MVVDSPERQRELRERVNNEVRENVGPFIRNHVVRENVGPFIRNHVDYPFEYFENVYDPDTDRHTQILEYWSVSNWLFGKLKDEGEPVANIDGMKIWGRTTSGQAIHLDYVIDEIFD